MKALVVLFAVALALTLVLPLLGMGGLFAAVSATFDWVMFAVWGFSLATTIVTGVILGAS